jgi:hypothetical protein
LFELLLVVAIIFSIIVVVIGVIGFGVIGAGCMGNQWYTEAGVLERLQVDYPDVARILYTERGVWSYSYVAAETKGGRRIAFELDTDILANHSLREVPLEVLQE